VTDQGPIFIGGVERSGTSLLYALLASHPNLAMTRRTNFFAYFYNRFGDLSEPANFERCLAAMMHYKRLVQVRPDSQRIRREFWQGEPTYIRLFTLLWEHYAERAGKPRWGDKSLNTERYADVIFKAYPNAKILQLVRDPRDRFASALKRWKVIRGGIGSGTAMWLSSTNLAKRNLRRYPDQYKVVRYETLAMQPEEVLHEVCDFIGEAYTPAMLKMDGAQTFRDDGGNSSYGSYDPGLISTSSIGRFRQVLSPRMIAFMQSVAGGDMLAYDYALDAIDLKGKDRAAFTLVDWPVNLARLAAWNTRETLLDRTGRSIPSNRILSEAVDAAA